MDLQLHFTAFWLDADRVSLDRHIDSVPKEQLNGIRKKKTGVDEDQGKKKINKIK